MPRTNPPSFAIVAANQQVIAEFPDGLREVAQYVMSLSRYGFDGEITGDPAAALQFPTYFDAAEFLRQRELRVSASTYYIVRIA